MRVPARKTRILAAWLLAAFLLSAGSAPAADAKPFPGTKSKWQQFDRYDFQLGGRPVRVIVPPKPLPGKPWLLLHGHDPMYLDEALIPKGFHFVAMDLHDDLGSPEALADWDTLYAAMTGEYGLARKVVLEAVSRYGLQVYGWAFENPSSVACIFAEVPVLDIKSWPGGKGKGAGSAPKWKELLGLYGFESEEEALEYRFNPVDTIRVLAEANVPILHVCGDADATVPLDENTNLMKKHYEQYGGKRFQVILKPGVGHELGLDDPTSATQFVLDHTKDLGEPDKPDARALGGDLKGWKKTHFGGEADVTVNDGVVTLEKGNDMTGITWRGPLVRRNYEITLEAMRAAGDDFFCGLTFPVGPDPCSLIVGGWGGPVVGLSSLDYMDAANNETSRFMQFKTGSWYQIRLRVTDRKIEAWIDKEQVVDVETAGRKIDIRWEVEASKPLGIASWRTTAKLRNFQLSALGPGDLKAPRITW